MIATYLSSIYILIYTLVGLYNGNLSKVTVYCAGVTFSASVLWLSSGQYLPAVFAALPTVAIVVNYFWRRFDARV